MKRKEVIHLLGEEGLHVARGIFNQIPSKFIVTQRDLTEAMQHSLAVAFKDWLNLPLPKVHYSTLQSIFYGGK